MIFRSLIVVVLATAVSCAGASGASAAVVGAPDTHPNELSIGVAASELIGSDARSMSPFLADQLYRGLARIERGRALPDLASSWSVNTDATQWTFHMRMNARWSNGDLITAEDVRSTWLMQLRDASAGASMDALLQIKGARSYMEGDCDVQDVGIEAIDGRTLRVTLSSPAGWFALESAGSGMALLHESVRSRLDTDAVEPGPDLVVSGPYRVAQAAQRSLSLEINDRYWDAASVRTDAVTMTAYDDERDLIDAYTAGDLDMISSRAHTPAVVSAFAGSADRSSRPTMRSALLVANADGLLSSDLARAAISLALDRSQLAGAASGDLVSYYPLSSIASPGAPGYGEIRSGSAGYLAAAPNLARARQMLAAAGIGEGTRITVRYSSADDLPLAAPALKVQLAAVGLDVQMIFVADGSEQDSADLHAISWHADHPALIGGSCIDGEIWSGSGWCPDDFDAALTQVQMIASDGLRQMKESDIESQLTGDGGSHVAIPLYSKQLAFTARAALSGDAWEAPDGKAHLYLDRIG